MHLCREMEPCPTRELDKHTFMHVNEAISNSGVRQACIYACKWSHVKPLGWLSASTACACFSQNLEATFTGHDVCSEIDFMPRLVGPNGARKGRRVPMRVFFRTTPVGSMARGPPMSRFLVQDYVWLFLV